MTIEAQITMRQEEDGGRHSYFAPGYCPHLVVLPSQDYLGMRVSAVLSSRVSGEVYPGEDAVVVLQTLYHNVNYDELKIDACFNILEGQKIVGAGCVLSRRVEEIVYSGL